MKRFALPLLFLLSIAVADEAGQDAADWTEASLKAWAAPLADLDALREKTKQRLADLNHESFKVRRAAEKALEAQPLLFDDLLLEAENSSDPEQRIRAERLREGAFSRQEERNRDAVAAARSMKVTLPFGALVGLMNASSDHLLQADCLDLIRLSAVSIGSERLLQASNDAVRSLGVERLAREVKNHKALLPYLKDTSDLVQLEAALALAQLARPEAVKALQSLRDSTEGSVAWQSSEALAWMSRKDALADASWERPIPRNRAIHLIGGKDLSGWVRDLDGQVVGADKSWQVKDRILAFDGNGRGILRSKTAYANYQLDLEWRWKAAGGDSGVWIGMQANPRGEYDALEVQLYDQRAGDFWVIGSYSAKTADGGKMINQVKRKGLKIEKPIGEWNRLSLSMIDGDLDVRINGKLCNQAKGGPKAAGFIGLQMENDAIEFRGIRLRPVAP